MVLSASIDLHIHSTYSDGMLEPGEIVDLARSRGLAALSITDHDTISGTDEAILQGRRLGVEVIPGIEISSWHNETSLHILGYGFRHDDAELAVHLRLLQQGREERNLRILENLNRLGIGVEPDELLRYSPYGQTGRPHIARLLVAKGVVQSSDQAFRKYLGRGAAAYAERFRFPVAEAIAFIREAGGMAVLAHPGSLDPGLRSTPALLRDLHGIGLEGIEVYYPSHSLKTVQALKQLARDFGLLITGGSDFHDAERSGPGLADWIRRTEIPYDLVTAMKDHRG